MTFTTPRPWPPNTSPSPELLAGWLGLCTDEERLEFCRLAQPAIDRGWVCYHGQHERRLDEVHGLVAEQAQRLDRYRLQSLQAPPVPAAIASQLEDLEEALRRIVCVLEPDGRHDVTDRDRAVLAVALDVLGLDQLPPGHGCPHGAHPDCPHETSGQ